MLSGSDGSRAVVSGGSWAMDNGTSSALSARQSAAIHGLRLIANDRKTKTVRCIMLSTQSTDIAMIAASAPDL